MFVCVCVCVCVCVHARAGRRECVYGCVFLLVLRKLFCNVVVMDLHLSVSLLSNVHLNNALQLSKSMITY